MSQTIIWGWFERTQSWEANVNARPVVFELLKRWRDSRRRLPTRPGPLDAPPGMRLPGEPE